MYSIGTTTVRRSAACLRPRLPDVLKLGSIRSHWSSVRSLGYDMPDTVTTNAAPTIGTPARASSPHQCGSWAASPPARAGCADVPPVVFRGRHGCACVRKLVHVPDEHVVAGEGTVEVHSGVLNEQQHRFFGVGWWFAEKAHDSDDPVGDVLSTNEERDLHPQLAAFGAGRQAPELSVLLLGGRAERLVAQDRVRFPGALSEYVALCIAVDERSRHVPEGVRDPRSDSVDRFRL